MAKLKRTKREALQAQRVAEAQAAQAQVARATREAQAQSALAQRQQRVEDSPLPQWYIKYARPVKWGVIEEREASQVLDQAAAAQAFAQARHEGTPESLGQGKYRLPSGLEFRIYRPRNVLERGLDEERAARSLTGRFQHGYALRELAIWGPTDAAGQAAQGRADLVVLSGAETHGFEIKTAQDTLTQFVRQQPIYEHQFHRYVLAVTANHVQQALKLAPARWGIALLAGDHEFVEFLREPGLNPNPAFDSEVLLSNLWVDDLHWITTQTGRSQFGTRTQLTRCLQKRLRPPELNAWALTALIGRSSLGGRLQCWEC
ncbi:sce7726 family protein [Deinococcus sp. QL22]|uniref:sce7726 family protein n=1 Tax=Deinococcus sp. QL22 TaxID=2939437 RepID=UPI002016CDFA|nr:sce7726 family protein [Deinococcus sp. QL22]UQN07969.1 sce7726 family protein [Deinococcus sp. QL22]